MTWPPPKRAVIFTTIADNDIIADLHWDGAYCSLVMDLDSGVYLFAAVEEDHAAASEWCRLHGYAVVPVDEVFEFVRPSWRHKEPA